MVYVGGGFYNPWMGFGPCWGWGGWGAYPPACFAPEGGVSMGAAMMAGLGAVELNVKPNRADVWVDGKYVGEARDLDGYPSYLWLAEGEHRVAVHKGGYPRLRREDQRAARHEDPDQAQAAAGRLAPAGDEAGRQSRTRRSARSSATCVRGRRRRRPRPSAAWRMRRRSRIWVPPGTDGPPRFAAPRDRKRAGPSHQRNPGPRRATMKSATPRRTFLGQLAIGARRASPPRARVAAAPSAPPPPPQRARGRPATSRGAST